MQAYAFFQKTALLMQTGYRLLEKMLITSRIAI